jgi:quinol monooxygenase YgiN
MVIVTGHLIVDDREDYLAACREVVRLGREAEGSLDFALSADLLDADRVNILERWESRELLERFRGAGTPSDLGDRIRHAEVTEHDVAESRTLA